MSIPGLDAQGTTPHLLPNRLNFLLLLYLVGFFFYIINFTITIFLSLFLPPSLSLLFPCYYPLFSLPATLSALSHPLYPCLHLLLISFPNLSPHYPSLLHTYHPLTSLLYQIPPSCYPRHSTLHYSNRNIPKHAQGP
jgi:hypothetical protein